MRSFVSGELVDFFQEVDRELQEDCHVVLIGGAVIALGFAGRHATKDIDYVRADAPFTVACEKAWQRLRAPITVQHVGIFVAPYSYEERLEPLLHPSFRHLRLWAPEAHDLALMKLGRGVEHDLQGIEDIHAVRPLSLPTLISRYEESLSQVTGNALSFKNSFLALVERLFSEEEALRLEGQLPPV